MKFPPAPTVAAEIASRLHIGAALLAVCLLVDPAWAEPVAELVTADSPGPGSIAPQALAPATAPQESGPALGISLGSSPLDRPITSPCPAGLGTPRLRAMWRRGIALERQEHLLEAAAHYEDMTKIAPRVAYAYWKGARSYWRHAETLPPDAKQERLPFFEKADELATRGMAVDPDCAECMLWKFGAMARIGTTRGIVRTARQAPEMEALLERGIELRPTYQDDLTNSTLGNLYYAGAVFYRVVPEWRWLDWVIGVRGDIDKSVQMIRQAGELDRDRIDYQVELGAALYCYAQRRDADWASEEAARVLSGAHTLPRRLSTDERDLEHAQALISQPERACGFSRDGWIDMNAERRRAGR